MLNHSEYFQLKSLGRNFGFGVLVLFSIFTFACQPPETTNEEPSFGSKSANITPTPKEKLTKFESELKSMRIADFYYVFTLKRKDGGVFDSEDKAFVRANKHYATNRFSFIENDTILFIGTNYKFSEENIEALKDRFEFQDFSKPEEQIEKERQAKKEKREKQNGNSNSSNTDTANKPENSVK
jgi:hypothetical protein